jgi:hypothetical protein
LLSIRKTRWKLSETSELHHLKFLFLYEHNMAHLPLRALPATRSLLRGLSLPALAKALPPTMTVRVLLVSGAQTRCLSTENERPPSNEEKYQRTFRGQMMGGIGQRLKREREELERWEEHQEKKRPLMQWSITFGEFANKSIAANYHLMLTIRS